MKSVFQKLMCLMLSVLLALPTGGFAQGDVTLSQCKSYGKERNFPCLKGRQVLHSAEQLKAATQPAPKKAEISRCIGTKEQETFPCRLALGSFALNRPALREVRRRVNYERQVAIDAGKPLTQKEIKEVIANSPGIVESLTPIASVGPKPKPKPTPKPTPKPVPQDTQQLGMPQCGRTDQQRQFPCALAVGGIAQDYRALRNVRIKLRNARLRAQAAGRRLTASELTAVLASTPGILIDRPIEAPGRNVAAGQGNGPAQVVTEAIRPGSVRSSDQEFDTAVSARGQDSGGRGLSKFEQALLLGLGAVAVGSVLRNGDQIVSRTGDRLVVQDRQGALQVLKDDDALVRRPGDQVQTQTFNDGSTRSVIQKVDGTQVITVGGRDGAVLRRTNVDAFGNQFVLFDDTQLEQPVNLRSLPQLRTRTLMAGQQSEATMRAALSPQAPAGVQGFSLRQVREIPQVRALAPEMELDSVRFRSGSAAIQPEQARALARIGATLRNQIMRDPTTVILIEGHTDAVGDESYNLALSDRRAETVALALTEYFRVPASHLITQGYGESALKVWSQGAEAANRRAVVRNITGLLR